MTAADLKAALKALGWTQAQLAEKLTPWICDNLYSYLDDSHVDTALRAIVRELDL